MDDHKQTLGFVNTVQVCKITKEFSRRFQKRFGREVTIQELNQLLAESTQVTRQEAVYKFIDGEFKARILFGEFWHDRAGIVMFVDEWKGRAITVVTSADPFRTRR